MNDVVAGALVLSFAAFLIGELLRFFYRLFKRRGRHV